MVIGSKLGSLRHVRKSRRDGEKSELTRVAALLDQLICKAQERWRRADARCGLTRSAHLQGSGAQVPWKPSHCGLLLLFERSETERGVASLVPGAGVTNDKKVRPPRGRRSDLEITTAFRELPKVLEQGLREHYALPRGKMLRRLMTLLNQLKVLETPRTEFGGGPMPTSEG
jgi:hypothetical protein